MCIYLDVFRKHPLPFYLSRYIIIFFYQRSLAPRLYLIVFFQKHCHFQAPVDGGVPTCQLFAKIFAFYTGRQLRSARIFLLKKFGIFLTCLPPRLYLIDFFQIEKIVLILC